MSKTFLFDEFSPVSSKEWKQKIQFDLKGADYNKTLVWESPEGIKVKPFYHSDDAVEAASNLTRTNGWSAAQAIYAGNAALANEKALKELKRGAESLYFIMPKETLNVKILLKDIALSKVPIYFEFAFLSSAYVQEIQNFAGNSSHQIYFNIDPIGQLARIGNWFYNREIDFKILTDLTALNVKNLLCVDLGLYQNSGADMIQQLAYALAHANEYLNTFKDTLSASFSMTFKIAIGSNYFFEIAKIRALRLLWRSIAAEYAITANCHIIAYPTKRNKVLYDYNTNMLRTTTECMSAVLGGADTVCNFPYDSLYHKDNEFANRIALNQLLLLKYESYFDKVDNAADGAYYIESITNQLAEKALLLFKSIEKSGGFLKELKAHKIQKKIQESSQKQQVRFNEGHDVLIGTNRYQNKADKMKDEIEIYPFLKIKPRKTLIKPILERRLAEEIEQKRLENE